MLNESNGLAGRAAKAAQGLYKGAQQASREFFSIPNRMSNAVKGAINPPPRPQVLSDAAARQKAYAPTQASFEAGRQRFKDSVQRFNQSVPQQRPQAPMAQREANLHDMEVAQSRRMMQRAGNPAPQPKSNVTYGAWKPLTQETLDQRRALGELSMATANRLDPTGKPPPQARAIAQAGGMPAYRTGVEADLADMQGSIDRRNGGRRVPLPNNNHLAQTRRTFQDWEVPIPDWMQEWEN